MEKIIFDKLRSHNKNAGDSSLKMYSSNIILVSKSLGVSPENIKPEVFKDVKKVMKVIEHQSLNTQKNKLVSVYMYLLATGYHKEVIDDYNDKIYILLGKVRNNQAKMEWSDKEKGNVISMDEYMLMLSRMYDELPKDMDTFKSLEKYMKYLTVKIYKEYPMRNDVSDMKIYNDNEYKNIKQDKDFNYMVINPKTMSCKVILNNFKTKKEGEIDFNINDKDLVEMIYNYYIACKKYYDTNDRDFEHWFLWKKDYTKMSRNLLTKYLINIFEHEIGKHISTTLIRKLTTTSMINPALKELSRIQGHSLSTAIQSYAKF